MRLLFLLLALAGTPGGNAYGLQSAAGGAPLLSTDPSLSITPHRTTCDVNNTAVGLIQGDAEIQFTLSAEGRADITTLSVRRTNKISLATAASASRRVIASCHFVAGEINQQAVPAILSQRIEFNGLDITVKDGRLSPALIPFEVTEHVTSGVSADSIFGWSDRRVEEKPVRFSCRQHVADTYNREPVTAIGDLYNYSTRVRGPVTFAFVVRKDGQVDRASVRAVMSVDAPIEAELARGITSCVYVPARIDGTPVNSWTRDTPWNFTPKKQ